MILYANTNRILNTYGQNVVNGARRNLKINGFGGQKSNRRKEASGRLGKSLGYKINQSNESIIIEFTSTAPYAAIVEEGRRKGTMPPSSALMSWIKKKPIRLKKVVVNSSGQKINKFVRNTPTNLKGAAYTMARSIKRRGIPAVPFFSEPMNDEFDKLPEALSNAFVQDTEDILFDQLTKKGYKVSRT